MTIFSKLNSIIKSIPIVVPAITISLITITGEYYLLLGILILLTLLSVFYLLRLHVIIKTYFQTRDSSHNFLVVSIAGILSLNLITLLTKDYSVDQFLASILLSMSVYPLWRYLKRKETSIPFVPVIALLYGLYYGVFTFLHFERFGRLSDISRAAITQSLFLTNIALVVLLITFYKWPRNVWRGWIPQLSLYWSRRRAIQFGILLGVVGLLVVAFTKLIDVPMHVAALVHFLTQLNLLAIAILFFLQLKERLRLRHKLLLWIILVPLELLIQLGTGQFYPLLRLGFMMSLLYILIRRNIPWKAVIICAFVGLVFMGARDAFRALSWLQSAPIKGEPVKRGLQFLTLTSSILTKADYDFVVKRIEAISQRVDLSATFAYVVEKTPDVIPYWYGETYATIFWRFIPRIIVPDKPHELGTAIFPDRYGLRDRRDSRTAIKLPQLVEMYINFGVLGILLGMFFMGIVYQVLHHILNHCGAGEWWQVSSVIIYSYLLDIEGNFTMVYGNVIYWIAILYLLGLFVRIKFAQKNVRSGV